MTKIQEIRERVLSIKKQVAIAEKEYYRRLGKESLADLLDNESLPGSFRNWISKNNICGIQYERVEEDNNGILESTNNLLFVSDATTPVAAISIQSSEFFEEATNSQDRSSANIHYLSVEDMFDDFEDVEIEFNENDVEITGRLLEGSFFELLRNHL